MVACGLRVPACLLERRLAARRTRTRQFPGRLLIVKVHGMGDSVYIRALIELLQRIHPKVEIGVMVGSATRELMTAGLLVATHGYDQKKVTPRTIVSTWYDIRQRCYEAIVNFEQGSIAELHFWHRPG